MTRPWEDFTPEDYSDVEAEELLKHLWRYCCCFSGELPTDLTVEMLAVDLAMSMDVTSDEADVYRREIEEMLS